MPARTRWAALVGGGAVAITVFVGSFGNLRDAVEAAESNFGLRTDDLDLSEAGARHYLNATIAYDRAWARAQSDKRITVEECDLLESLDRRSQFEFGLLAPGLDDEGHLFPTTLHIRLCREQERSG